MLFSPSTLMIQDPVAKPSGISVEAIELGTSNDAAVAETEKLHLSTDTVYALEFEYWTDTDACTLYTDLYPDDLPESSFTATRTLQKAKIEISSNQQNMPNCYLRFFRGGKTGNVYVTNVIFYEKSLLGQTPRDSNPFRFKGEYTDIETGYLYLRNRYYDPATSRMLTEDPIKDGLNWYTYANNNPVMFVDPLGLASVVLKEYAKAMGATTKNYTNKQGNACVTVTYNGTSQNYILNSGKIDDSVLNTKFSWENSWIPNGKTEAVYTGVHEVAVGNYHSSIIIFAAPGSKYYNTANFRKNKYDGGMYNMQH